MAGQKSGKCQWRPKPSFLLGRTFPSSVLTMRRATTSAAMPLSTDFEILAVPGRVLPFISASTASNKKAWQRRILLSKDSAPLKPVETMARTQLSAKLWICGTIGSRRAARTYEG
ncbi:hypothetical protein BOTCAL_0072g00230 [Botryotinia calthae]|uniref:Uncharacterized protein n=1 Tax=Botryotinia calthae TaxID=38488 RepID=A0A4Y8DBB0_9HELO|nr:hypothetical protein BOTCAL_0072g00230 [Botryotinia calthae]